MSSRDSIRDSGRQTTRSAILDFCWELTKNPRKADVETRAVLMASAPTTSVAVRTRIIETLGLIVDKIRRPRDAEAITAFFTAAALNRNSEIRNAGRKALGIMITKHPDQDRVAEMTNIAVIDGGHKKHHPSDVTGTIQVINDSMVRGNQLRLDSRRGITATHT